MLDVYEICKKLKPLIGEQAERYWLAYVAEDMDGKRELADTLQLQALLLLGSNFEDAQGLLSVPPKTEARGEYPIGTVTYAGRSLYPFGLRESEWLQHIGIFGRSGAGKTNTVFLLIKNLLHHHKPFLIFDWKRNYRDLLIAQDTKTLVYTVGGPISPWAFNPLIPPKGVAPEIWLKKLIEIIAHAYYLGEGVMYLLQEGIHAVYKAYGVYKASNKGFPTFIDVLDWLESQPVKGRKSLWMDSAMRGIKSICFGPMGKVVNTSVQSNLAALLQQNVILELDRLTNADKALIVESMLLWIHHYRLGEPDRETFKHALIIEEAHHILAKKVAGQGGETITETVLREIRELGEAIIVVDQHPSMLSTVAMGNTSCTICLNLKHRSDVTAMGSAMLMDIEEREILGMLSIGEAVVKLQNRWLRPFQISIPHQKVQKGAVTDARLAQLMQACNAAQVAGLTKNDEAPHPEKRIIQLTTREETFLLDIAHHPFSGVVERYRRLHTSRRKGNSIKERCLTGNLIAATPIPTQTGQVVLLELTSQAKRLLQESGHQVSQANRRESRVHEYWKHKAAEHFAAQGYDVSVEEPVNGFTDLVIQKNGARIAVEIETGKSDWRKNLQKNLKGDFQSIIIITTNETIYDKLKEFIEENHLTQHAMLYRAQEIL